MKTSINPCNMEHIKIGNMVEVKSWDEMSAEFGGESYKKGYGSYLKLPDGYTIYKGYLTIDPRYDELFEHTPEKFTITRLGDDLYNWASHKVSPYMVKPIPNIKEKIKFTTQKIFDWYCTRFRRPITIKRESETTVITIDTIKALYDKLLNAVETEDFTGFTSTDITVIFKVWDWYVECSVDRTNAYLMHFDDGDSMMTEKWTYYLETNIRHQNNLPKFA